MNIAVQYYAIQRIHESRGGFSKVGLYGAGFSLLALFIVLFFIGKSK